MPSLLVINGEVGKIILAGKFDYSVNEDFRQTITETLANKDIRKIQVDLAEVTFMDSSAISLLLLLHERASSKGVSVILVNCREPIREIFSIGGFDNILTIH